MGKIALLAVAIFCLIVLLLSVLSGRKSRAPSHLALDTPVNELERALLAMQRNERSRKALSLALQKADLYFLARTQESIQEEQAITLESDTKIDFKGWMENATVFIPVFSSLERMQQAGLDGEKYIVMRGEALPDMFDSSVVLVLNHQFDCEMKLSYDDLCSLVPGKE